jgi:hypothetical protein
MESTATSVEALLANLLYERPVPESIGKPVFAAHASTDRIRNWAIDEVTNLFRLTGVVQTSRDLEARLRVALHLAPKAAIRYDRSSRVSRRTLIQEHLKKHFEFADAEAAHLARRLAVFLDAWDAERDASARLHLDKLLERQAYRCAACRFDFSDTARIAQLEREALEGAVDAFKPYFDGQGVAERTAPQVDHRIAVSADGTNRVSNLQVLCALCNLGKYDGFGIPVSRESQHAATPIDEVPEFHRMQLLYYTLRTCQFACARCGSKEREMTIRPVREEGAIVLTNLAAVCIECA